MHLVIAFKELNNVRKEQCFSCLVRLLNMQEVAMRNLNSIVTRMVARAFHAFVQGRLKAELPDSDFNPRPDSSAAAVEQKSAENRPRQIRGSERSPIHWTEYSRADLPTIGVL